jgi:hypothetical protein
MEEINETPTVLEQHIRNAVDYGLAMAATATPEQIQEMLQQNDFFERGLEICLSCGRESSLKLENCESCGNSKIPF